MDNRISDKDLEFVNGGVNNSEEAISGAIDSLRKAVATCAQLQVLSTFFEPKISGCIQRLQSCNGDYIAIRDVRDELSHIKSALDCDINHLSDDAEQRIYGDVHSFLTKAINQLS